MTTDSKPTPILPRVAIVVATMVEHFFLFVAVCTTMVAIVPEFEALFAREDQELPAMTIRTLSHSWFWVRYWYLAFIVGLGLDAIVVAVLGIGFRNHRWVLQAYSRTCLLLVIVYLLVTGISLAVPIRDLNAGHRIDAIERDGDATIPEADLPLSASVEEVIVNIDAAGKIVVGGEEMTLEQLTIYLEKQKAGRKYVPSLVVRSDPGADLQHALQVLDVCKKAGYENYSILTTE